MPSPEGKGIARRAWDAYANAVTKATRPYVEPFAIDVDPDDFIQEPDEDYWRNR
jgi:hypothetical protein